MDDAGPKLDAQHVWKQNTPPRTAAAPRLGWLYHEGNSSRVYRFTIVTDDGRRLVMHHLVIFPMFFKAGIRKILGMAP